MIIDAHIHAYPADVFASPRRWAAQRDESWWADTVDPVDRCSIQGWADVDTLIRDMDTAGIDRAVMLGWYWQHQSTCEENNHWMAQWRRAHPDRLYAFAAVNPAAGQMAIDQTRRWLNEGFSGIGELLDRVQGYRYADNDFAALAALAADYRAPLNLHVTDPKLHDRPGMQPTPLSEFIDLAAALPRNQFILAHLGGGLAFHSETPVPANLYFDTAAVPLIYEPSCYRDAARYVGAERILFGTDYPLRTYPRSKAPPDFDRQLGELKAANFPAADFDAIAGGNLLSLIARE